jgi:Streptomycin adenylyltransferase
LLFTADDRQAVLHAVLALAEQDDRLDAAVLTGSMGTERSDRWSDIDLDFIVREGESTDAVTEDWTGRCYERFSAVHHYATVFDSTQVRGFLLPNGLLLDLAFEPSADFAAWDQVRVMFDRTGRATDVAGNVEPWRPTPDWPAESGFGFHDIVHACTALIRGRLWQALFYLQRVRNRTLSLASERHGFDATEFRYVDDLPPAEWKPLDTSMVDRLEPASLLEALEVCTHAFLTELGRGDPQLEDRLRSPLTGWLEATRESH